MFLSSAGFPTAALAPTCWARAAAGWRGCLEESPVMAAHVLVWGQLYHLQGWETNSHQCELKQEG